MTPTPIRTTVVTLSPLLADLLLRVLAPRLHLEVVGVLRTRRGLAARLHALAPDLVLYGLTDAEMHTSALTLLRLLPSAAIVAVTPDGRHAWFYEMRPHRTDLLELSVSRLVRTLRSHFEPNRP